MSTRWIPAKPFRTLPIGEMEKEQAKMRASMASAKRHYNARQRILRKSVGAALVHSKPSS